MKRALVMAVALAAVASGCPKKPEAQQPAVVLTTPEVAATGIVRHLADVFAVQTGRRVEVRVVAPAAIFGEAKAGHAGAVVVNDAATLDALTKAQLVRLRGAIGNDDYLIVGPRHDPARVRSADSAPEAFRRIFARRRAFCSPSDVAPFRAREEAIWTAARLDPRKDRHYRVCPGDATAALQEADRAGAYTLTDRATFDALRPKRTASFLWHVPMLSNDFAIVLLPGHQNDAEWFVEWIMSYRGREAVDSYRVGGARRVYVER